MSASYKAPLSDLRFALYDVLGVTASVNDTSRALLGQFALTGVSREQGFAFARRFLESVKWTSSSK